MRLEPIAAAALFGLLAACAPTAPPASTPPPLKPIAPALVLPPRTPEKMEQRSATVHLLPGLEGVIGATPAELSKLLGPPRLDVIEGDARKLQFAGESCVLDIYFYPKSRANELAATYTEARNPITGQTTDSVACVNTLRPPAPVLAMPPPPGKRVRR